jgi:hypothetical protein
LFHAQQVGDAGANTSSHRRGPEAGPAKFDFFVKIAIIGLKFRTKSLMYSMAYLGGAESFGAPVMSDPA